MTLNKTFATFLLFVCLLGLVGAVTFSDRVPAGDHSNNASQKIAVTITDPSGVNKAKIDFEINGFNFALNDPRMSYNEATGRLEYTPVRPWNEFDEVHVFVSAENTLGERGETQFNFTVN